MKVARNTAFRAADFQRFKPATNLGDVAELQVRAAALSLLTITGTGVRPAPPVHVVEVTVAADGDEPHRYKLLRASRAYLAARRLARLLPAGDHQVMVRQRPQNNHRGKR